MNLQSYLPTEDKLKGYKVHKPVTLFEQSPAEITYFLRKKRCPKCLRKLYPTRDGKIWRCKSVKKDGFIIKSETLKKYGN